MRTITPDQAREWQDNARPGPWDASVDDVYCATRLYERGKGDEIEDGDSWELARHAPDLAQTIAGMRWEWACEWDDVNGAEHGPWHALRREAEIDVQDMAGRGATTRLVRRMVGPVEVAK